MEFDVQAFLKNKYKDRETVKIINPKQSYFYMSEGVYPLWNEAGYNEKIVFVFLKEPTLRLFSRWREFNTSWKKS